MNSVFEVILTLEANHSIIDLIVSTEKTLCRLIFCALGYLGLSSDGRTFLGAGAIRKKEKNLANQDELILRSKVECSSVSVFLIQLEVSFWKTPVYIYKMEHT